MPVAVPFLTIPDLFVNLSRRFEDKNKTLFAHKQESHYPYETIKWHQFSADVRSMASYLLENGVKKGDRIAILSENRYEWAVTDFAIHMLGGINVSIYTTLPSNQVEFILNDSGSTFFFVSTGIQLKKAVEVKENCPALVHVIAFDRPKNEALMAHEYVSLFYDVLEKGRRLVSKHEKHITQSAKTVSPDDIACLIYTSGTTGNPKGAMLTHNNIVSNVKAAHQVLDVHENDRCLSFLPLSHSFERTAGYYVMLAAGAEIYFAESVDTVAKNLVESNPTLVFSVPRLFERIYNLVMKSVHEGTESKRRVFYWALEIGKKYAAGKRGLVAVQHAVADKLVFEKLRARTGKNLRFFVSGGAALPPDIGSFFMAAGLKIMEGYGLTETSPVISVNPPDGIRIGSVGHVLKGVTVGIQRVEDGKIIAEISGEDYPTSVSSEEGEILCKGPNVMKGYWGQEKATAEVIDANGWFHTGDIGKFDNGYLRITDRLKHMIVNAGGKNIYPGPIEDALKTNLRFVDQVILLGERKNFVTALIVPNFENMGPFLKENNLSDDPEEIVASEFVQEYFRNELKEFSKSMASHEKVRDFRLLPQAFSIESGEMTPTLKIKRKVIEKKYASLISKMYSKDGD